MAVSLFSKIKKWIPQPVVHHLRRFSANSIKLSGRYSKWSDALCRCEGYNTDKIIDATLVAAKSVMQGQAVYSRDGELFDQVAYSWPVTTALMWVAAQNKGNLNILDFGGSFASSYFQNKKFLVDLTNIHWHIVEQERVVDLGTKLITNEKISFHSDIKVCLDNNMPDIVLLSSVLQYLENPLDLLSTISEYQVPFIVIDRTPFLVNPVKSYLRIQKVPKRIYRASYPCWLFSKDELTASLYKNGYALVEEFDSLDDLSPEATWQGLIFRYPPRESLSE
jgi:putative methyltransferase (TIGR04325 family)